MAGIDFLINFAGNVASTLVSGAIKHARFSCCFNSYLEEHTKEKDGLITKRVSVQNHADNAKRQTKETDPLVIDWLDEANTLIGMAERLQEKANTKKGCCRGHCPNWIRRYSLGKQLAEQKDTIVKHNTDGSNFLQGEALIPLPGMDYYSSKNFIYFDSTKIAFDKLLEALKDDKISIIGLHGMGGCGKTAMAKELGRKAEDLKLFDKVVYAIVSNVVDVLKIQGNIANSIDLDLKEEQASERARRLWLRLTSSTERILIILDDVWEELNFEAIGIHSNTNHESSCKVLLTTRDRKICTALNCQRIIPLKLLGQEEAWILFKHYAQLTDETSFDVRNLADQILEKCDGLPVAIAAVASSLKGEGIEAWRLTLRRMRNYEQVDVTDSLQKPYTCLRSSYDNLKDQDAKLLFSLCSVFPEDFEISEELLITFVKGLGLFDQVNSYDSVRDQVIVAKDKLIKSCLLLDDELNDKRDNKIVKMHDLVRDVALWIGKEKFKLVVGHERSQYSFKEGVTRKDGSIKYLCCEAFPSHLDYPKLEFLFVSVDLDRVTIPDKFFEGLKKLKVLALHNKGEMNESPLTMQFQKLINLRCLYLYRWYVSEALFSNDRLNRLESLRLFKCRIWENPFERNNCDDGIIGSDTEWATLEELIIDDYYYGGGGFTTMPFVRKPNLFNLRVLRFRFNTRMVYVFTPAIAQSLKLLEELHIDFCNKLEYIFGQDNDGYQIQNELQIELPHLKLLKLGSLESLVSICPENYHLSCPSLLKLCLEWCPRLTGTLAECGSELAGLPVHIASLQNLEQLEIRDCGMRYIFSASTTKSLPRLKELIIVDCGELEQIFMDMVWSEVNDGTNSTSILSAPLADYQDTNRQNSGVFELTGFGIQTKSLQNLVRLRIGNCKIRYIFSTCTVASLPHLRS